MKELNGNTYSTSLILYISCYCLVDNVYRKKGDQMIINKINQNDQARYSAFLDCNFIQLSKSNEKGLLTKSVCSDRENFNPENRKIILY